MPNVHQRWPRALDAVAPLAVLATLVMLLLLPASSSAAAWNAPAVLDSSSFRPTLRLDANEAGGGVAAWSVFSTGGSTMRVAVRSGGVWGAPVTLDTTNDIVDYQVAIGEDGTAAVAWYVEIPNGMFAGTTVLKLAVQRPGSGFATVTLPGEPTGGAGSVAVDGSGATYLAYADASGGGAKLRLATIAPDGSGSVLDVTLAGQTASDPELAVNASGDLALIWEHDSASVDGLLGVSRFDGSFQDIVRAAPAEHAAQLGTYDLGIDAAGNATLVYSHRNAEFDRDVYVGSQAAGGVWTVPVQLSPDASSGFRNFLDPQVAVASTGHVIVTMAQHEGRTQHWFATSKPVGGSFRPLAQIGESAADNPLSPAVVSIAPDGSGIASWTFDEGGAGMTAAGDWVALPSGAGFSGHDPVVASDGVGTYHRVQFADGQVQVSSIASASVVVDTGGGTGTGTGGGTQTGTGTGGGDGTRSTTGGGGGTPPSGTGDTRAPVVVARLPRTRMATLARRGIPMQLRCNERCTAVVTITLPARTARQLGLRRRAVVLGRARATLPGARARTVRVRVNRAHAARMLRARRLRAVVAQARIVVVDRAGNRRTRTMRVVIRR